MICAWHKNHYPRRQIKSTYQSIELDHVTQINLNDIFASSSAKSPKLHRRYLSSLLDQFPPFDHSLYPPPPPQLPTCILPAGVAFHSSGFVSSDPASFPRSYPIIAFRDRVCEDVTEAYRLPPNTYTDKCICIVSHAPSFRALRDSLEEIFVLYFSSEGSCPTGETTFAATAELPLLSANVLSASSKGCGDLADEGMVAQITVAKHRKPNHAPFVLTKKKMMNVILDPIEDSTESQVEKTYSLLGMCRETLAVSFQWCTYITFSLLIFTAAFDGLQSSFAGQKSSVGLINLTFIGDELWPHLQQY
ncbi:unnamed protein product [Brassica rapa]|uniref:UDENN domain-containing protein n=1 Tax=Brassica campestris TaxID=3711 RepID=A0A8D9GNU6_BRACM|nr:unnamed protein product [Brassica rapa]